MKSSTEFYRDSTRIYDLTKEYHELSIQVKDLEDGVIEKLPNGSPILENDTLRGIHMRKEVQKINPDLIDRWRELWSEIDAMHNEQQAVVAAGWAASYELTTGSLIRQ